MAKAKRALIDDELPADLVALFERHAGEGVSTNPDDCIWTGEDRTLDPYDWVGLSSIRSLELILSAIIRAHPLRGVSEGARLQRAMKALVGKSRTGRPSLMWPILLEIGRAWWPDHLSGKIKSHRYYVETGAKASGRSLDEIADFPDFVKRTWTAFEGEKDRVLMEITERSSVEQRGYQELLEQTLGDLAQLGIVDDKRKGGKVAT